MAEYDRNQPLEQEVFTADLRTLRFYIRYINRNRKYRDIGKVLLEMNYLFSDTPERESYQRLAHIVS